MTLAEVMAADFQNAINDAPTTATISGTDYTGTTGPLVTSKKLMEGGFLTEPDYVWCGLVDDFETLPTLGATVTISNTAYRIEKITKDEFGVAVQFDLITPNK